MLHEPRVVIIILNWNGIIDTLACLESVRQLDYANHKVVVVDQNSDDGSRESIANQYPEVTLIRNEDNLGFATGNNIGIRHAMDRGADYIVLLNNDTIVRPTFLTALVAAAREHPDFDVFGPKIVFDSDPNVIWAAGSHIDWQKATCIQRGYQEIDRGQYDTTVEVNALSGCAMMISSTAFQTVGLLDDRFFAYYEETDWCARAKKAGLRILYVPTAVVRHKVSRTIGPSSPAIAFYMVRNNLLFVWKNSAGSRRLSLLGRSLHREARTICSRFIRGGRHEAVIRLSAVAAFLLRRFGKTEV
jgi:GT2 family glycosyltransferase